MTQENEYNSDRVVWWILQRIKRKLLKTPDKNRLEFYVHVMENEPAIPAFNHQETALKELQQMGAIAYYEVPQGDLIVIGMNEYAITLVQPKFDQVFAEYENKLSPAMENRYALDLSSFSEDLRSKIMSVIKVIKQKYELEHMLGSNLQELQIPHTDFLNGLVTKDDLERILLLFSKKLAILPRLKKEKGVSIEFSPAFPAAKVIQVFEEYIKQAQPETPAESTANAKKHFNKYPYKILAGTKWENITIQFLDEERVNIILGKHHETNYADMGFVDGRSGKPNTQWALLRLLAKHNGEIAPNNTDANSKIKKTKQLLSKQLRNYFPIEYDPFYPYEPTPPYKDTNSYKIKLQLIPPYDTKVGLAEDDEISNEIQEMFRED